MPGKEYVKEWWKNIYKKYTCPRCCNKCMVKIYVNTDKLTCMSCGQVINEKDENISFWWKG